MDLTPEQIKSIERLHENEALTENLTDTDARALLDWAQAKIVENADGKVVQAAVSAANNSGQEGVLGVLAQANAYLAQAESTAALSHADATSSELPAPIPEPVGTPTLNATTPAPKATDDAVADEASRAPAPSEQPAKSLPPVSPKPKSSAPKKSRKKSKRSKK